MVMHGQTDLLEILLGNKANGVITPDGDLSFFAPHLERDQQLDTDILDIIDPNDEATLIPDMDILGDDGCQVVEVVAETVEIPQETPSTSSTILTTLDVPDKSSNQFIFQFPEPGTDQFSTIDLGFLTEVSDINDVTFTEDTSDTESYSATRVSSTPFSPTSSSISTMPPTPDTASSLDSNSSNVPSFVKEELKFAIRSKRQREGKEDLKVEFVPPAPEQLTEEEEIRRIEKRERNKLAAQKCREKKRILGDKLEAETKVLMKRQNQYKTEIQKLLDERETLLEMINVHKAVCPKFRAKSANF
ncbi:protein c-Fos-like [Mercenaria mercenaria]|uniref:protein c-Fos-like n=1 Tax=Mercenaria mercenaria TaxID=6596 RepID=UPI00234F0A8E|nr:protein c-Fos-like [Mercenaria mercenaria]XP_053396285.1 protein c-Fos-like [Mercenaria mercenaria]XP_053396294.1 protein c-Fos-like [Mercenaria mercenaria]